MHTSILRFVQRPKRPNGLDRKDGCLIAWQREAFRLIRQSPQGLSACAMLWTVDALK